MFWLGLPEQPTNSAITTYNSDSLMVKQKDSYSTYIKKMEK